MSDGVQNVVQRIDRWLSHEPVFNSGSGAVAGVTVGNEVVYHYGEIAGYYLAYLAGLMVEKTTGKNFAPHAASLVGRWLRKQWRDGPAPTRLYASATEDWRNDHVFLFDLAMILRGLTAVRRHGAEVWHGRQIAEFIKTKLIDSQGELLAFAANKNRPLPMAWSTDIDGHQLKAAAGLIAWGTHFDDPVLCDLGQGMVRRLTVSGVCDWPHLPLHPRLYALEGALLCGLMTPASMAALVQRILSSTDSTTERIDTVAQLLRLALFSQIESKRIEILVKRLLESVDTDGSVRFRNDRQNAERNTWCAIFTHQALCFYSQVRRGIPARAELCI